MKNCPKSELVTKSVKFSSATTAAAGSSRQRPKCVRQLRGANSLPNSVRLAAANGRLSEFGLCAEQNRQDIDHKSNASADCLESTAPQTGQLIAHSLKLNSVKNIS